MEDLSHARGGVSACGGWGWLGCMHACMQVCMQPHACMRVCLHAWMHACKCVCVCMCVLNRSHHLLNFALFIEKKHLA